MIPTLPIQTLNDSVTYKKVSSENEWSQDTTSSYTLTRVYVKDVKVWNPQQVESSPTGKRRMYYDARLSRGKQFDFKEKDIVVFGSYEMRVVSVKELKFSGIIHHWEVDLQ